MKRRQSQFGWRVLHLTVTALLCCAGFLTAATRAGTPVVNSLVPRGGQRGRTVTIEIRGSGLERPVDVMCHGAGISVVKVEGMDGAHARGTLQIAADAPIGLMGLRFVGAWGASNLKLFSIGDLPEIDEVEPNGDRARPQEIALPVTINGTITAEDVDLFAFDGKAGQRLAVEVEAMRLGDTLFDPAIAVYGPDGKPVAAADDTPLEKQDAAVVFTCAVSGKYTVEMRETAYGGGADCRYRLHVGAFPRPAAVTPSGGEAGSEVEVSWLGDPVAAKQRVRLPLAAETDFVIVPTCGGHCAPSAIPFRVCAWHAGMETEPNGDDEHATKMTFPGGASGVIAVAGDVDCFVFEAAKGTGLAAQVFARRLGSPLDSVLELRKFKGGVIASNDDSNGPDSALRATIPETGKYVLAVRDLLMKGGPSFTYFLEVGPIEPGLSLTMQPESGRVNVAAGNRVAMLVTAARRDFSGALKLRAEGLPAGVTMAADEMAAGVGQGAVVFEAGAAASQAVSSRPTAMIVGLVHLTATFAGGKTPIVGHLAQPVELVRHENNPFYSWTVRRLALAVCDAAPVHIEVVEPQVPVVQRGSMELRVRVIREAGFKGDVTLRMLWNPPGLVSGQTTVPANASEGRIPLNARDNASAGTWRTAVVGAFDFQGGTEVSTKLFKLEVARPLVEYQIARARTDKGKDVEIVATVAHREAFEGEASAELLGLPPKVTAAAVKVNKDTKETKFAVHVEAGAPAGQFGDVTVRTVVMRKGEPIVHLSTPGVLVIEEPRRPVDPRVAAARVEAKRKADEAKVKQKADRLAAAEQRRKERARQQAASRPSSGGAMQMR